MKVLARVWIASQKVGLLATVGSVAGFLVAGALLARLVAAHEWQHAAVGHAVVWLIAAISGVGGLIGFWLIVDHWMFLHRGYRVRRVADEQWCYDERVGRTIRSLPFVRVPVGEGYPAPCDVRIAGAAAWDAAVPPWATGRRAEITKRIAECFGADRGGRVSFGDA